MTTQSRAAAWRPCRPTAVGLMANSQTDGQRKRRKLIGSTIFNDNAGRQSKFRGVETDVRSARGGNNERTGVGYSKRSRLC